jgi:transcription-repair coupling factor (superfamily II helicase)
MPVVDGVTSLAALPAVLRDAEGFPGVTSALRAGGAGTIDGAWGSSAALAVAAIEAEAPTTVLVALAHPGDVESWSADLASFTGSLPAVLPAFESWPPDPSSYDDTSRKRLRLIQKLASDPPKLLLTTMSALMQPVPARQDLESRGRQLRVGNPIDLDELGAWLVNNGYKRVDACELHGEFSRRGGILDIFSLDADDPVRLEFFGDEIESIRRFSIGTQRSLGDEKEVVILSGGATSRHGGTNRAHITEHLPQGSWFVLIEPTELHEQGKFFLETVAEVEGLFTVEGVFRQLVALPNVTVTTMPRPSVEAAVHLRVESVERFSGNVNRVRDELDAVARQDRVLIACNNEGEISRLTDVLAAGQLAQHDRLKLVTGSVRAGFRLVEAGIVVLGSHELFHREQTPAGQKGSALPRRRIESRAIDSFLELNGRARWTALICGDVGYGKTEVAMRAAFKAVDGGKQVAVLVPTTVLAEQHYAPSRERLAEFPVTVEVLNRFPHGRSQQRVGKGPQDGGLDIVIGTHRLVSKDVQFKDLGLVIIDEEQRFGVEHKERLKRCGRPWTC